MKVTLVALPESEDGTLKAFRPGTAECMDGAHNSSHVHCLVQAAQLFKLLSHDLWRVLNTLRKSNTKQDKQLGYRSTVASMSDRETPDTVATVHSTV